MGAKQSKRSVDISGKEAEGAGEVAAAGAGGEGRVEPLADADALKPQLNGDAHIHDQTDKEKQLDSGTPENEKDATTEKEEKQEESEKEKDAAPVTNGDTSGEQKTENGDSAPTPEESKKPKKEKVKLKWSLRSISFSRKEKPKQEKRQKEEEPKTNGEPEKVPEEVAKVNAEPAANNVEETKSDVESKEEKTPETPVTEPITNGSNTPESPKVEIPPVQEITPEVVPPEVVPPEVVAEPVKTEPKVEPEPEQLPINGLSLDELKSDVSEVAQPEESKPEETPAESTETVPVIEIPVQKEVCVDQMPLIESSPPPLPANPPPSSVASFAATTMAPDLTDASLVNTAETVISTPPVLDTKTDSPKECPTSLPHKVLTNNEADTPSSVTMPMEEATDNFTTPVSVEDVTREINANEVNCEISNGVVQDDPEPQMESKCIEVIEPVESDIASHVAEDFPPPPPLEDNNIEVASDKQETMAPELNDNSEPILNNKLSNGEMLNGIDKEVLNGNNEIEQENLKNKTVDSLGNVVQIECNGNMNDDTETKEEGGLEPCTESIAKAASPEQSLPPSPSEAEAGAAEASDSFPAPPSECSPSDGSPEPDAPLPQETIAVSDKIADLIPEVPVVPDLNTETLQETTDIAVVN